MVTSCISTKVEQDLKQAGFFVRSHGTYAWRTPSRGLRQVIMINRCGDGERNWCWRMGPDVVRGFSDPWSAFVHAEVNGWTA